MEANMLVQIGKWGASHAIRIPKEVVDALDLKTGEEIDLEFGADKIVMKKKKAKLPTYAEMIEMMRGQTPPPMEWDLVPVGKEIIDDEYSRKG
jgi:antitoxin MazE